MRIGITGATGFLGRKLVRALTARGDTVVAFTRDPRKHRDRFGPRVEVAALAELSPSMVERMDAVVNLAGEPVSDGRWTDARKDAILRSRVEATRAVVTAIGGATKRPSVLVNASAVGFYGPRGDEEVDEQSPAGDDFLAHVCAAWESEAKRVTSHGVREVRVRIGVVLGDDGGALAKMLPAFKAFVGGPIGDGRQWFPWVHVDDVVSLIVFALDRADVAGPLNATAPTPVRFRDFAHTLGEVLHRPAWLPVPAFALRAAMGEMSTIVLSGQRAIPRAAMAAGFAFAHGDLREALQSTVGRAQER